MKPFRLALCLSFVAIAAACGSAETSKSPVNGDDDDDGASFTLTDGTYDFVIDQVITDTCWAPPKTYPELPMTLTGKYTTDGDTVTIVIENEQFGTQTLTVTKDGNELVGGGTGQSPDLLGCILDITGAFDGVLVDNDTFDAVIDLDVKDGNGNCAIAVGTTQPQVDTLPCNLELAGQGKRVGGL